MTKEAINAVTRGTVYNRVFKPKIDCTLYHYCITPRLLSNLEFGKRRFSDVSVMNDHVSGPMSMSYSNALLIMAPRHRELEGLDAGFFEKVDEYLSPKQLISHPGITCFLKTPDVLSKWRGYADDGHGWSIGFNGQAIEAMPDRLPTRRARWGSRSGAGISAPDRLARRRPTIACLRVAAVEYRAVRCAPGDAACAIQ